MQSGFRRSNSTTTALLKVTEDFTEIIEDNKDIILVFLDLKKAFDLVDHHLLLKKLRDKFSFSFFACKLLKSYLSDRCQRVFYNEERSDLAFVSLVLRKEEFCQPFYSHFY